MLYKITVANWQIQNIEPAPQVFEVYIQDWYKPYWNGTNVEVLTEQEVLDLVNAEQLAEAEARVALVKSEEDALIVDPIDTTTITTSE